MDDFARSTEGAGGYLGESDVLDLALSVGRGGGGKVEMGVV